uniref:Uncharacterized protein n=1 Tax=Candidatus Kentrum sp. FW TaxID=2126338 RepID=A0A450TSM2_9GAMM|nr:MAG: hypothetical protein BECKFW1821A_GA0114235_100440 [Candidatus Kentron sp. FW]VFJ71520.1 MAG: hypothetical protein BECKFW1821B_GA0114236_12252 [Candidatus Kentron sp. FW]
MERHGGLLRNATEDVPYRVPDFGCTRQPRYGSLVLRHSLANHLK